MSDATPFEGSVAKFKRMRLELADMRTRAEAETVRADKAEAACRR